jgi:IS30 family transposase
LPRTMFGSIKNLISYLVGDATAALLLRVATAYSEKSRSSGRRCSRRCPAERRRSRLALTLAEREVISRGVTAHRSARSIAKLLGRSPSTVSREMSRNGGCDRYRATLADENAWARSRRSKCCKLATNRRLRQAVAGKLRLDWSPEQIAGWLKRTHPEDEGNQVSHETIYRGLFRISADIATSRHRLENDDQKITRCGHCR